MIVRICLALHVIAFALCPARAVLRIGQFRSGPRIRTFDDDGPRFVDSRNSRPWSTRPRKMVRTPTDLITTDEQQEPSFVFVDGRSSRPWSSTPSEMVTTQTEIIATDDQQEPSIVDGRDARPWSNKLSIKPTIVMVPDAQHKPSFEDDRFYQPSSSTPRDMMTTPTDVVAAGDGTNSPGRGFAIPNSIRSALSTTGGTFWQSNKKVSWWYDHQVLPPNSTSFSGAEFVPQVLVNHVAFLDDEATLKNTVFDTSTKYIMGFNEPNVPDKGTDVTPAVACGLWQEVLAFAKTHGLRVVSPSVDDCNKSSSHCNYEAGEWLDEFFSYPACGVDTIDAIGVHKYGSPESIVKTIERLHGKYQKPIWLTEFGPSDCDKPLMEMRTLELMLKLWKKNATVLERYAWGTRCNHLFHANSSLTFDGEWYFSGKERWELDAAYKAEKIKARVAARAQEDN